MTSREETRAALALARLGRPPLTLIRQLVDACGSPARLLAECRSDPTESGSRRVREQLDRRSREGLRALRGVRPVPDRLVDELHRRRIRVLVYGSPAYPARLGDLPDPPMVLYALGRHPMPSGRLVCVVGTRRATEYGRRMAADIGAGLARVGCTVVSGMARGIDGVAHRAALEAGGFSVGVLGSGFDHRYPRENRNLYRRMEERGLLLSEFSPDTPPRPYRFPRRNRILAALGDVVVVVQAGRRSGALNTAGHALELGREVAAVPGPVGIPASLGVHDLIRDGAALVTGPEDVVELLGLWTSTGGVRDGPHARAAASEAETTRSDPESRVRRALGTGPAHSDVLLEASGLPPGPALALLGRLEVEGVLQPLPGGRYGLARPAIHGGRPGRGARVPSGREGGG